jgi:hypothetical protein
MNVTDEKPITLSGGGAPIPTVGADTAERVSFCFMMNKPAHATR